MKTRLNYLADVHWYTTMLWYVDDVGDFTLQKRSTDTKDDVLVRMTQHTVQSMCHCLMKTMKMKTSPNNILAKFCDDDVSRLRTSDTTLKKVGLALWQKQKQGKRTEVHKSVMQDMRRLHYFNNT